MNTDKSFPVMRIVWVDTGARLAADWADIPTITMEALGNDMKVESIGFLIYEDEQHVLLAQSWDQTHGYYLNAQQIFAGAIIEREVLA